MRISDWSSDVCSSDLGLDVTLEGHRVAEDAVGIHQDGHGHPLGACGLVEAGLYGAGSPGHGGDMVNLLLRCREALVRLMFKNDLAIQIGHQGKPLEMRVVTFAGRLQIQRDRLSCLRSEENT